MKPSQRYWFSLLFALFISGLSLGWALPAAAQGEQPTDDEVNTVARELFCPVCENIPLDVCPTQACAEWRELIRQKLTAGWTPDQVKRYFVDQYGDRVLGVPPARGLNWLVYLVPPLAFLFGLVLLYRAFKSWQKPAGARQPAGTLAPVVDETAKPAEPNDRYVDRLEEDLKKLA